MDLVFGADSGSEELEFRSGVGGWVIPRSKSMNKEGNEKVQNAKTSSLKYQEGKSRIF